MGMKYLFGYLIFLPLLVLVITSCQMGNGKEDDNSAPYPTLLTLDLPEIQAVIITAPSIDIRTEEDKKNFPEYYNCDDFQVTQNDMENFFKLVKKISKQDYMHATDWVSCQAFGEIHFVDGTSAQWGVNWSAAGFINFSDGRRTYLLCEQCTKPFVH